MHNDELVPTPRFTGIFIPIEILEIKDLTFLELILLSWIDALYCPKHKGCYASNAYLASRLQSQPNTVAKALTSLRSKNLIEDVSYDGRTRIIRSLINRVIDKTQSNSDLDKNPIPLDENPRVYGQKSKSHIYESKVERKDNSYCPTSSVSAIADDIFLFFLGKIKERKPDFKGPTNPDKWKRSLDLLIRRDKREPERIKQVIDFIHKDPFWSINILSPDSLRKQFDRIELLIKANENKDRIQTNRQWALYMKEKYPEKLKGFTFDNKYAKNQSLAKEIPFDMVHEAFKQNFASLFGGEHVRR